MNSCGRCKFYDQHLPDYGQCKRRAPVVMLVSGRPSTAFPTMAPDEYCWEFDPSNAGRKMLMAYGNFRCTRCAWETESDDESVFKAHKCEDHPR